MQKDPAYHLISTCGSSGNRYILFLMEESATGHPVYEIVTPEKGMWKPRRSLPKRRASFRGGDQAADFRYHLRAEERSGADGPAGEIIAIIKVIPEMVQLNSAESRVNLANISLKQVEETYKRDTQLFKQGVIAQEDFDLSKANYLKAVEEKDNHKVPWRSSATV